MLLGVGCCLRFYLNSSFAFLVVLALLICMLHASFSFYSGPLISCAGALTLVRVDLALVNLIDLSIRYVRVLALCVVALTVNVLVLVSHVIILAVCVISLVSCLIVLATLFLLLAVHVFALTMWFLVLAIPPIVSCVRSIVLVVRDIPLVILVFPLVVCPIMYFVLVVPLISSNWCG